MSIIAAAVAKLCDKAFLTAAERGFWEEHENPLIVPTKVMLIVTELAELIEAHRSGDDDNLFEELADVWIRLADLMYWIAGQSPGMSLSQFMEIVLPSKLAYNETRPHKHGKRY